MVLLDRAISNVYDKLDEKGMLDNSVIVIASDNGACYQAGGSNYPLRGTKHYLFEGGIKVPAVISSPGLLPDAKKGTTYEGLFHISDWLPTFLHMTNIVIPEGLYGVNQYEAVFSDFDIPLNSTRSTILVNYDDLLTDPQTGAMSTRKNPIGAYIKGDYKLIINEYFQD